MSGPQSLGFPYALSCAHAAPLHLVTQADSVASSCAHVTWSRSLGLTEAAGQGAPGGRRSKVGHEHSRSAWPGAAGRCQSLRSGSQITAHPGKSSSKASPSEEPSWLSVVIVVVAALNSHPHPTFSSAVPLLTVGFSRTGLCLALCALGIAPNTTGHGRDTGAVCRASGGVSE